MAISLASGRGGREEKEKGERGNKKGDLICKSLTIDRRFVNRAKGNLHSIQEILDVYWLKGRLHEEYSTTRPLHRISGTCIILVSFLLPTPSILSPFLLLFTSYRTPSNSSPLLLSNSHSPSSILRIPPTIFPFSRNLQPLHLPSFTSSLTFPLLSPYANFLSLTRIFLRHLTLPYSFSYVSFVRLIPFYFPFPPRWGSFTFFLDVISFLPSFSIFPVFSFMLLLKFFSSSHLPE